MKILFIHSEYRDRGGEETLVDAEMALLEEGGHEVELILFRNGRSAAKSIGQFLLLPFNPFSYHKVRKKITEFRPDIVHLHNWHFSASPSVIIACRHVGVPVVSSLHNFRLLCPSATFFYDHKIFEDSLEREFPWKAIMLGVYRGSILQTFWLAFTVFLHKKLKTWQHVDRFILNSDFEKQFFLKSTLSVPKEKFAVKFNSMPDKSARVRLNRQDHFLFVGRLVEEKGVLVLLEAFGKTDLPLVIYGYGPLEPEVKMAARQCANITFGGALPLADLSKELSRCKALIFPSMWYEGMPMTLVESFSTGTPVIASNLGAASSMIMHKVNGLHFEAGQVDDLLRQVDRWATLDKEELQGYCQRTRAIYERDYTPLANLKSLTSIYQEVEHNVS